MNEEKPEKNHGELETLCNSFEGAGGTATHWDWIECSRCHGAGYVPTEFGEQVLELIRHNLRGSTSVLLSSRQPPGKELPLS